MHELHERFAAHHFVLNQITEVRQRRALRLFAEVEAWLGRELHTAEPDDLTRWMTEKIGQKYDPNTVRFWLNMLRPYFRWAWESARLIDADKWLRISAVKPPRGASGITTPKPYKKSEIQRLWVELDESIPPLEKDDYFLKRFVKGTSKYKRLRQHFRNTQTRAIVSLALIEGLRRDEIYGLDLDELHPENAYLLVKGKRTDQREKTREVPYAESARGMVEAWLRLRKLLKPKHSRPWLALQPPNPQRPMGHEPFSTLLAKVGSGYELHRLRHTFATERLRANMPIERLQVILGHSNLQQTLAYAKLAREDLQGAMERSDEEFMAAIGDSR
jgi:site-specific recombinase XerD